MATTALTTPTAGQSFSSPANSSFSISYSGTTGVTPYEFRILFTSSNAGLTFVSTGTTTATTGLFYLNSSFSGSMALIGNTVGTYSVILNLQGSNTGTSWDTKVTRTVYVTITEPPCPFSVNIGGTWKQCNGVYVNADGVWKEGTTKVNVGGTWK